MGGIGVGERIQNSGIRVQDSGIRIQIRRIGAKSEGGVPSSILNPEP
jgi:hypothetical protein